VLGSSRLSTTTGTVYPFPMSEAEKKARLAEALRANLRKRKAQARAQESVEIPEDATQRVRTQSPAS